MVGLERAIHDFHELARIAHTLSHLAGGGIWRKWTSIRLSPQQNGEHFGILIPIQDDEMICKLGDYRSVMTEDISE
jgi:hypothetical protein